MKNKNSSLETAIILVAIVAFIFGSSYIVKSLLAEPKVEIAKNLAEEHLYNNKTDEAINEYKKMQGKEEWPIYTVKVAEIYSMQGEYKKSTLMLEEALRGIENIVAEKNLNNEEKVKYSNIMNDIVFTFYMNNELEMALYVADNYLKLGNVDVQMMRTIFTINMELGNQEKAAEIYSKYPIDRNNARELAYVANMAMLLEDYDKGLELLKSAWDVDPNEITIYEVVKEFGSSNNVEFNSTLDKLIEEKPNEISYKMWRAYEYSESIHTITLAKKFISGVSEAEVKGAIYNYINAQIYTYEGNNANEKKYVKELETEKTATSYYLLAKNMMANKEFKEAEKYLKMSITLEDNYAGSYILMPEILTVLESEDNQNIFIREAIKKEPFNLSIIIKSGDAYAKSVLNSEIAKEYYRLALALAKNESSIYYKIASVEELAEKHDEAIIALQKAVELKPDESIYYRALGTIYMKIGEYEKGIENTREAYRLNKSDILALSNAGVYYIMVEGDISRGFENIEEAYENINEDISDEFKKNLTDNYNKAKGLFEQYKNGKGKELEIPEFELFY